MSSDRWTPDEVAELLAVGTDAGLAAVGVCSARPWTHTRGVLEQRRAEGRAGAMAFTYRRPARSADPTQLGGRARSLVVGAMSYLEPVPDRPTRAVARVARYATTDHYGRLAEGLGVVAAHLRERGHRARVVADDNGLVDREAAWRAALGSYGKNTNLMLPGAGSWYVLGAVVTDAAFPPGRIPVADQCGPCRRCLDGCPTGAIVAPGVVDARRCLAWMLQAPGEFPREHRAALGDRLYGCDDCQEVCPPNRRMGVGGPGGRHEEQPAGDSNDPGHWVDVAEALAADDTTLLARFGRWYLADRDVGVLRRNLLVVAGNSGPPPAPDLTEQVARHLRHPDDVVAAHAAWAATQLGRADLLEAVDVAGRTAVAAEVAPARSDGEDSRP